MSAAPPLDPYYDRPDGFMELLEGDWNGFRHKGQSYRAKPVRQGLWEIAGLGPVYQVDLGEGTCECPHHTHRLAPGERCKHIDAILVLMSLLGEPVATEELEMTDEELKALFR
jgi:hypothetical protein